MVLLVVGGIFMYTKSSTGEVTTKVSESENSVIEITSEGFSPNELTVKSGESVTWTNKDSKERWPASAMHPTHTVYAGVNYDEEGSFAGSLGCKSEGKAKDGAFDACVGLKPGENWSFTFNQKGSWNYHDHLVSGNYGKIIVE